MTLASSQMQAQTVDSCMAPSGETGAAPSISAPVVPPLCLPVFSPSAPPQPNQPRREVRYRFMR